MSYYDYIKTAILEAVQNITDDNILNSLYSIVMKLVSSDN